TCTRLARTRGTRARARSTQARAFAPTAWTTARERTPINTANVISVASMIRDDVSSIRSGTHVVFETATAQRLTGLGATRVVRASDRLVIGPSRRDVEEHARLRAAWWRSYDTLGDLEPREEWDHLSSTEARWEPPIVLWASADPNEKLNLWRTCHWLH